MLTLLVVGFLGGLITSISPCVLPVLPVVLTAGASRSDTADGPRRSRRPLGVVFGLVVSFCGSTLLGSAVLSALGLPQDLLRNLGIAVLIVIGAGLLVPALGALIERPFARLTTRGRMTRSSNGFVLGIGLGLLYVPCAGPVLATIAVVGATHRVGFDAVVLTAAFGIGAGVPLLVLALAGETLTVRVGAIRRRASAIRMASGAVMILVAVLIAFNLTDALQRHVPGYTTALQNSVEGGRSVTARLNGLTSAGGADATNRTPSSGDLGGACTDDGTSLENCGRAPNFTGITGWLNTPGDRALSLSQLRGKVVLVDFWTYSCINCQRSLPHVEGWYREYQHDGFVVVGVHTPEFAFEHVRSNIASQARSLGVKYPIAIDDNYATWTAYHNQYWPAEYLIDARGNIRHVSFGEGGYATTQNLIRTLLRQANPEAALGARSRVPQYRFEPGQTPETYLGTKYAPLHTSPGLSLAAGHTVRYSMPTGVSSNTFALGGTWTPTPEYLRAGAAATLELSYTARDCYLVLGGTGTVHVAVDGTATRTIRVGGPPKLYTLVARTHQQHHTITLSMTIGVDAYDFTFG